MASEQLFGAFPAATRALWEAVITKELKGKELDSLAIVVNGASLKPFHMAGEREATSERRRGTKRTGNPCRATILVDTSDTDANDRLLEGLLGGADGVTLHGPVDGAVDALKDVLLGAIDVQFAEGSVGALSWLLKEATSQEVRASDLSLCMGLPHDAEVRDIRELIANHPRVRLFTATDPEQGRILLGHLLSQGFTIDDACARIQFDRPLGDDLFV